MHLGIGREGSGSQLLDAAPTAGCLLFSEDEEVRAGTLPSQFAELALDALNRGAVAPHVEHQRIAVGQIPASEPFFRQRPLSLDSPVDTGTIIVWYGSLSTIS